MKHQIPTTRIEAYYNKIKQINKKLSRRNLPPIQFEKTDTVTRTQILNNDIWFKSPVKVQVTYQIIELITPLDNIEVDGAKYIGTVKHNSDGSTSIYSRDEENHSIRHLHEATHCDHCHTNRLRKTLHVFEKDSKELVIGSTCCNEYFGFSVEATLSTYQWFLGLEDTVRTFNEDCQSDPANFMEILAVSQYVISDDGTYKTEGVTTGTILNILKERDEIQDYINSINTGKLIEIIEWWQNKKAINDFEFNVKSIFENYSTKSIALIACGVWVWMKERNVKTNEVNDYFGEKSKRYHGQACILVKAIHVGADRYNNAEVFMYLIKTTDGITLKWVSSSKTFKINNVKCGDAITIDFTVKRHESYRDTKQTIIARMKLHVPNKVSGN